ncbi:MAG: hypothetical protein ACFB4J_19540 [Elainellaceae cyanobacterium]
MSLSTAAVWTLAALATGDLPHVSGDLPAPAASLKLPASSPMVMPNGVAVTIHKVAAKPVAPERLGLPESAPASGRSSVLPARPIAASPVLHHHLSQLEDAWIIAQAEPDAIAPSQAISL